MKATQGASFKDPMFQTYWGICKQHGLLHGAYHFLDFSASAQGQADNFLSRGVDWSLPGVLPPVLDIEDQVPATNNHYITDDRSASVALVTDWLDIVAKETGRVPIIYSYKSFFSDFLGGASWPDNPLWLAAYQANPPGLPAGWSDWIFWQNSQYGTMAGDLNGGEIDLDYFNGTVEQLAAM